MYENGAMVPETLPHSSILKNCFGCSENDQRPLPIKMNLMDVPPPPPNPSTEIFFLHGYFDVLPSPIKLYITRGRTVQKKYSRHAKKDCSSENRNHRGARR